MRLFWKIATPVLCLFLIGGAEVFWSVHKDKAANTAREKDPKLIEATRSALTKAETGDAKAEDQLGLIYYYGRGIQKNNFEAFQWWQKAAVQGYAKAQHNLGHMYYDGEGTPQDLAQAVYWYRKAAIQGDASAQYSLGYMYEYGYGVSRDRAAATRWYQKSADLGDVYARRVLDSNWLEYSRLQLAILLLEIVGGAFLLVGMALPNKFGGGPYQKYTLLAGVLCFLSAGMNICGHAYNDFRPFRLAFIAFASTKLMMSLTLLVLLFFVLPKAIIRKPSASPNFRQLYRVNTKLRQRVRNRKKKPMRYIGGTPPR